MLAAVYGRLRAYVLLSMMTFSALVCLVCFLAMLPLAAVNLHAYRRLGTSMLEVLVPGFLLAPTLSGLRICVQADEWPKQLVARMEPLTIIMCNHASRVDWLLALWCGYCDRVHGRVSFLTEGPMQFLPIVGWLRKLNEDIFVWRSFKMDKPRIDANLLSFKRTDTRRALFLAIEGAIVDKGEFDRRYIADCRRFCEEQGYEPFEYLLTPRYKGVHTLAQHAEGFLFCTTNAFERNGRMLNTKLNDPNRVVPDLFSMLAAPMRVTCHWSDFELSADQEVAKKQCMDNYMWRDSLLKHFHEHGEFPGGMTYVDLPCDWALRTSSWLGQALVAHLALYAATGNARLLLHLIAGLACVLGACHTIGQLFSGESRESIPFETIFKSYLYHGRDERLLSKEKNPKAKAAKDKDMDGTAKQPAEALSETAKMFNLMTKFPAN